jgi:hypothetical protein
VVFIALTKIGGEKNVFAVVPTILVTGLAGLATSVFAFRLAFVVFVIRLPAGEPCDKRSLSFHNY